MADHFSKGIFTSFSTIDWNLTIILSNSSSHKKKFDCPTVEKWFANAQESDFKSYRVIGFIAVFPVHSPNLFSCDKRRADDSPSECIPTLIDRMHNACLNTHSAEAKAIGGCWWNLEEERHRFVCWEWGGVGRLAQWLGEGWVSHYEHTLNIRQPVTDRSNHWISCLHIAEWGRVSLILDTSGGSHSGHSGRKESSSCKIKVSFGFESGKSFLYKARPFREEKSSSLTH